MVEGFNRIISSAQSVATRKGMNIDFTSITNTPQDFAHDLAPMVSLLLYLCSDEPEICDLKIPGHTPHKPKMVKTKRGNKLFPANHPTVWTVGAEIASKIRSFEQSNQYHDGVKPHVRRAHWHGYWKGPKDGNRRFGYKWLPPIVVRV